MFIDAKKFFNIEKSFNKAGYYKTEEYDKLYENLKSQICSGGIFTLTGMVGSGKTTLLHHMQQELELENKIKISRSLSTERKKLNIGTLYLALFYDLNKGNKDFKIPTQGEKRERKLIELINKHKKSVALFIDEAHDIHSSTLTSLKRMIEIIGFSGSSLSIVLAGHPKLKNNLLKSDMEEISARTKFFDIDNIINNKEHYIQWLLNQCLKKDIKPEHVITKEAIKLLADRLVTPLQITHYLQKAIEQACLVGEKPVTYEIIEQILLPDLNSLKALLARSGYQFSAVCELLGATPKETREFLEGKSTISRKNEYIKSIQSSGIVLEA